MKRILIAVTAMLALGAGGAVAMDDDGMMAEGPALSLSGSAGLGATFTGEMKDGTTIKSKSKINFNHFVKIGFAGSGTTDTGLTFGADVRINASDGGNKLDDADVFIGGDMWTFTVGTPDRASDLAFSLGDVGWDNNLSVDDVAEGIGKATGDPQARLDLTFGVATVAVSVGQKDGVDYKAGSDAVSAMWTHAISYDTHPNEKDNASRKNGILSFTYNTPRFTPALTGSAAQTAISGLTAYTAPVYAKDEMGTQAQTANILSAGSDKFYVVTTGSGAKAVNTIYKQNGQPDFFIQGEGSTDGSSDNTKVTQTQGKFDEDGKLVEDPGDDGSDADKEAYSEAKRDAVDTRVGALPEGVTLTNITEVEEGKYTDAKDEVAAQLATEQDTLWSLGAKFDIGPATLGFGFDSEKAMLVSVGGNFGSVGGSIFYGQRDIMVKKVERKASGLGAEVKFEAGEGTTVNVVATQYEVDGMKSMDMDGFGAGVKHDLGGGATVEAGFAQVDDVNKASVGVTMSF